VNVLRYDYYDEQTLELTESAFYGGNVSPESEPASPSKNTIGFRLKRAPSEAELDAEEWRLP